MIRFQAPTREYGIRSVHIIAPALPPALDGIGDYTARLSAELARSARVKVLAAHQDASPADIAGVRTACAFDKDVRRSVRRIADVVRSDKPDWVVLQFNQFSYGKWGLNPYLPGVLRSITRMNSNGTGPRPRVAVMFHEAFVPATTWKFRIMRLWQIRQFRQLGRAADVVFFSIQPWVETFKSWFPGKPVLHLPVGSNIPVVPTTREEARARLSIQPGTFVLGLFGTTHASRMMQRIRGAASTAAAAAKAMGRQAALLYIGPHAAAVRAAVDQVPVLADGPLAADEVSRRLAAIDVALAPFVDGVSTRRGSFMAALAHGVPSVATVGPATDSLLRRESGRSLALADVDDASAFERHVQRLLQDEPGRLAMGRAAAELYRREFDWPRIAERLLDVLSANTASGEYAKESKNETVTP